MAIPITVQKIRERALEAGFFLPLGVYDRVSDAMAEMDTGSLRKLVEDFVDRGQSVLAPVETRLRTRTNKIRTTTSRVRETVSTRPGDAARSTKGRATSADRQATMSATRVATPTSKDLAIDRYDSLTVNEIMGRLEGLTNTELAKIYKYEAAHDNRSSILGAIDSKMTDLPVATYDALTVVQIKSRLAGMSRTDLERVKSYESTTKKRKMVLEAVRIQLSS